MNKIHFILASVPDKNILTKYIYRSLDEYQASYSLESKEYYWQKCVTPSRWGDAPEVVFVKKMLQRDLPKKLRNILTDELFKQYVSSDEKAFSKELYMSIEQISCLQRNGMYVGSHGFDHFWLNSISEDEQRKEIALSLEFLTLVGSDPDRWIMCYPFGAYNESLLAILKERNCLAGLTTKVDIVNLKRYNPLILPRLNTNDLPNDSKSGLNEWTEKAVSG